MRNIINRVNKKIFKLVESNNLKEIIVTPKFSTCLQLGENYTIDPNVFIDGHLDIKLIGSVVTENGHSFSFKRIYGSKDQDQDHKYEIIYDSDMNKIYTCVFDLEFPQTLE